MALIKALTSSVGTSFGDQFKEFIECPQIENNVIIQRGIVKHGSGNSNPSEGIISNGSTIAVPEGMAMMIVDNGKIVEFSADPGTFTWDTSSEPSIFTGSLGTGIANTFKTIGQRFTYGGQTAKDQRVYFVNIKNIPGNTFGSTQPEPIFDPVYGSVEITYNGEYTIKVIDPIVLVNKVVGANPKDTLTFDDIFKTDGQNILKSKFAQKVSEAISNIMTLKNVSFNRIQSYKSDITDQMNQILDKEWTETYGILVEDVALRVNASESSRKIVQEMDAEIAKTTRMSQVYSNNMQGAMAAATGEAMKSAASNENGAMMGFMGMGMANAQGSNVMGTVANMGGTTPSTTDTPIQPMPGTINPFAVNEESIPTQTTTTSKVCPKCGTTVNGKFCSNCGEPIPME